MPGYQPQTTGQKLKIYLQQLIKGGIRFGRPSKLDCIQIDSIKSLLEKGNSVMKVADTFKAHLANF